MVFIWQTGILRILRFGKVHQNVQPHPFLYLLTRADARADTHPLKRMRCGKKTTRASENHELRETHDMQPKVSVWVCVVSELRKRLRHPQPGDYFPYHKTPLSLTPPAPCVAKAQ